MYDLIDVFDQLVAERLGYLVGLLVDELLERRHLDVFELKLPVHRFQLNFFNVWLEIWW